MSEFKISPEIIQNIFKIVFEATKSANVLPKLGEDYELYASYPVYADLLKSEGDRILNLMTNIFRFAEAKVNVSNTKLLDELCERLEKANDTIAERLANFIDEAEGRRKQDELILVGKDGGKTAFINTSWNKRLHQSAVPQSAGDVQVSSSLDNDAVSVGSGTLPFFDKTALLLASRNVVRPQIQFQDSIDNVNRPFVSKLNFKHNAKAPIKSRITLIVDDFQNDPMEISDVSESKNPYKFELDHFEPCCWQLEKRVSNDTKDVDETELIYVDTDEKLDDLIQILKNSKEFAVDIEHHSYRSFQGLTCLIQISTRNNDFIIDTLKLWRSLHKLNDPFSDSQILKVFHGADKDIEWLQRDFGVYVVNLFDTGQAMRILGLPRFSLAYLVRRYFKKDLNKQFQLADWRIRPLPEPLIRYAREDTHFLLACCDRLTNELLDQGNELKNLLKSVYERSRDLCATHYEKPLLFDDDYLNLYGKSRKIFNSRQTIALRELYSWRDKVARVEDESIAFVLPDHMLLQIAEVLPKEMQGVLACCNPVPPLVRQELHELHRIILRARESKLESKPKFASAPQNVHLIPVRQRRGIVGSEPHDFAHSANDEELTPLSQRMNILDQSACESEPLSNVLVKTKPDLFALFTAEENKTKSKKISKKILKIESLSRTPYDMYLEAKIAEEINQKGKSQKENEPKPVSQTSELNLHSHFTKKISAQIVEVEENIEEKPEDPDVFCEPPKKKRKGKKDISSMDVQPFDYETADRELSSELNKKREDKKNRRFFNPDKEFLAKGKQQNRKKFGNRGPKTGFFKSTSTGGSVKSNKNRR